MTDIEGITLEAELVGEDATRDIAKAVSARHTIARKYVMRLRRRHPDATPAEVIQMLERHYATSITTAGALISAGAIAADIGIAMIPGVGAAAAGMKSAGQQAAKKTGKEAVKFAAKSAAKQAAKNMAMGTAKNGAQRAAALLPAGDEQLQFEITAVFALAIADIHGMDLDKDQALALVYGLSNERVSQKQIATMATDLSSASAEGVVGGGNTVAAGRADWSHWANTLADTLPGGAAQSLVRTMETGELDTVRQNLSGKQQATIEYGVGALAGGVTRFVFGREVVTAARAAFAEAPDTFPEHLAIPVEPEAEDGDADQNRALAAMEDAAKMTGNWIAGTASTVGGGVATGAAAVGAGVATAADTVSRAFRSVDIDGDGIPDEPQALTAVRGVGGAIAGTAGSVGGSVAGLFKRKKRGEQPTDGSEAGLDEAVEK
jgi:Tfp pilus assembly protein PilE